MTVPAEALATKAVNLIAESIDFLRSIPAFTNPSLLQKTPDCYETVRLFSAFSEENILDKVQRLTDEASVTLHDVSLDCDSSENIPSRDASDNDERFHLVHDILLPLLQLVGRCYIVLDRLPTASNVKAKGGKQQRPLPPPGMLSLKNYTDVACLMELTVCSGILPLLEDNILMPIESRIRYALPKSLAGRMPRLALLWAQKQSRPPVDQSWGELAAVAQVVGQLALLERFKPMILPRHIADLYAAILQARFFQNGTRLPAFERLLPHDSPSASPPAVNSILQARAFQTLLLHGTSGPIWLRQRVSILLTGLAAHDLPAILQVFCHSAAHDRSAAGIRLARALVTTEMSTKNVYLTQLCKQVFGQVLEETYLERGSLAEYLKAGLSIQQEANIHTCWAILDVIPSGVFTSFLIERIRESIAPLSSDSTTRVDSMVRQIGTLLLSIPPSVDASTLCTLMLSPLTKPSSKVTPSITFLGVLLRLASMPCVTQSRVKEDTRISLRLLRNAFSGATFEGSISNAHLFSVGIVHALAPCQWDLDGNSFRRGNDSEEGILVSKADSQADLLKIAATGTETRSRVMAATVLLDDRPKNSNQAINDLCSIVFGLLLRMYLSREQNCRDNADLINASVPKLFHAPMFDLVPLVCLPIVCEECPVSSLLTVDDDPEAGSGIFDVIELVFLSLASRVCQREDPSSSLSTKAHPSVGKALWTASDMFLRIIDDESLFCTVGRAQISSDDDEQFQVLLSVSSLLLSIFVSILELGAEKRSESDELRLQSLKDCLQPIAELTPDVKDALQQSVLAELAEMASHALALLASRVTKHDLGESTDNIENRPTKTAIDKLTQAQQDLESEEPPLRARGVVGLRHLALSLADTGQKWRQLNDSTSSIDSLLHLSVKALCDKESYVYIAAIHTIAVISEVDAGYVLPKICEALVSGMFPLHSSSEMHISTEQRIKLAEALIFSIRRRASVHEYCPVLIESLLFGAKEEKSPDPTIQERALMQRHTHEYLMHGCAQEDHTPEETLGRDWDEIGTRVKVGGPLFSSEENDALRASMLHVTAELLAASYPAAVARFSPIIVQCATAALCLDSSRPVRRAGAFLSKVVYSVVLREQASTELHPTGTSGISFSMSLAACHDERALHSCLERCYRGFDLNDASTERLYDPATEARCKEALDLRQQAEESGILAAGRIALAYKQEDEMNPIARLLKPKTAGSTPSRRILIEELE